MSSPLWLMRAFSSLASNSRSGNNIVLHTAHPHTRAFSSLLRNRCAITHTHTCMTQTL